MTRRGFSEQAFFVLSALAAEPMRGYALLSEVANLSGGRIDLRVGTLYGIVDRLAGDALIEIDHEEVVDSRLRRYYRLSTIGRRTLANEAERLAVNAKIAAGRLSAADKPTRPARSGSLLRHVPANDDFHVHGRSGLRWSPTA